MRLVGDVCAGNCLAYGPGLEAATCNVGAEFTVELKDELGNRIMRREEVSVAVTHQASKSKVEAGVSRQQDGTYQVLYTPEQQGEYAIELAVGATGIQGSPFKVIVAGISFMATILYSVEALQLMMVAGHALS